MRCFGGSNADSMSFDGKYVASSAFVKKPLPLGRRTINDDFSTVNSLYGGADCGFYARELPIFDKRSIQNERKLEQYRGVNLTINLKIENSARN